MFYPLFSMIIFILSQVFWCFPKKMERKGKNFSFLGEKISKIGEEIALAFDFRTHEFKIFKNAPVFMIFKT